MKWLLAMQQVVVPDDDGVANAPLFGAAFTPEDLAPIPTFDLPFGIPGWLGRDSGHSTRNGNKEIVWQAL